MNYQHTFLDLARQETIEAAAWYDEEQQELGERFIDTTEKLIQLICGNPHLFAKKKKEYREALIKPFPFLVVYRIDKQQHTVVIVAVFHTSRNPKGKYNREK